MRSGTSFIGQQLNSSPELVGCPFELRRIWTKFGVPMGSDVCQGDCPAMDEKDGGSIDLDSLKSAFAGEVVKSENGKLFNRNARFLNKCPHLSNKVRLVEFLFPQAQFIWTYRNIEDVVSSLKNLFLRPQLEETVHYWPKSSGGRERARCFSAGNRHRSGNLSDPGRKFPGGNVKFLAEYWLETCLYLTRQFQNISSDRYTIVDQGRLFAEPEVVQRSLEDYLGIQRNDLSGLPDAVAPGRTRNWNQPLTMSESDTLFTFVHKNKVKIEEIEDFVFRRASLR